MTKRKICNLLLCNEDYYEMFINEKFNSDFLKFKKYDIIKKKKRF